MAKHAATISDAIVRADEMTAFWNDLARSSGVHPDLVINHNQWKADRDYFADFAGSFSEAV